MMNLQSVFPLSEGIVFLSIFLNTLAPSAHADDWSKEKEERKDRVTQEAKEAGKAVIDAQEKEKKALDRKNAALEARFTQIKILAEKVLAAGHKQNSLLLSKSEALQQISRATFLYIDELKRHLERYYEITPVFLAYKATEPTEANSMMQNIRLVPRAQSVAALIRPMINICEITKGERTSCSNLALESRELAAKIKTAYPLYQSALAPYGHFLQEYPVPVASLPVQVIQQLESMAAYTTVREHGVSGEASEALPRLSKKMDQMLRETAHAEAERLYQRRLKWQEGMDFFAIVNGLGRRRLEIAQDPANQLIGGRRPRLTPHFEIFENIASYQDRCADSENMDLSTSMGTACLIYKQMLRDVVGFFEHGAVAKVAVSLSSAKKNAPEALVPLVERLDEALTAYDALGENPPREDLLALILVHDDLLMQWNELLTPSKGINTSDNL